MKIAYSFGNDLGVLAVITVGLMAVSFLAGTEKGFDKIEKRTQHVSYCDGRDHGKILCADQSGE